MKTSYIYAVSLLLCGVGLTAFTGCKRKSAESTRAAEQQLTIAIGEAPNTADPVAALDVGSTHLVNAMHAPLTVAAPDGKLVMVLAQSINMAADGLSCDIVLKPAKFWNAEGSPVTAEDVRYSFERVRASAHPHRWILDRISGVGAFDKKEAAHISGIEVGDERRLTIRFSEPEPDFPSLVSSGLTAIIKSGSDKLNKLPFDQHLIGAGAWKPVRFDPGATFTFTMNHGFPGASTGGARLTLAVETNPQNQLDGLKRKRFDAARLRGPQITESCEMDAQGLLKPKSEFSDTRLQVAQANELTFLKWNWASAELSGMSEPERREFLAAVSTAVDRAGMVKALYLGAAEPAFDVAPPSTIATKAANPLPTAAKQPIARKVTLLAPNDPASRALAAYLQSKGREIGLTVEMTFVDLGTLVQRVLKGEYTVCLLWIEQQIPSTGCFAWTAFWTPGSPLTIFGQELAGLGDAPAQARSVPKGEERRLAYSHLAAQISAQQTAWTPLLSRSAVVMANSRCDGLFLDRNGFPYYLFLRVR